MDTIRAAVTRAPAAKLALAFPLGVSCPLVEAAELEALQALCQASGKIVVVLGGDPALRASAVAAGFAAATSLAEWVTPPRKAGRRRRITRGPRLGRRATAELEAKGVQIVRESRAIDEDEASDLYDLVGEDPPRYVTDLVAADEAITPTALQSDIPTLPLQRSRITRQLEETRREAAAAAALDREQQEYEERVTHTIRATGAVDDLPEHVDGADNNGADPPADTTARTGS